jgi:hypothetical protein
VPAPLARGATLGAVERWRAVVLVEGQSDRAALEALAARRGRDLAAEGVRVVAMGGATNVRTHLARYGPGGRNLVVAGLCDAREAPHVTRALADAGVGGHVHVCVDDLEDELIRAAGVAGVERVIAAEGEARSLRILRREPAQRDRTQHEVLWRFMGSRSGRKLRYARRLVEALDPACVPAPLDGVLAAVALP